MKCLICRQAELTEGFASVLFERGEMKFTLDSVPAWICPSCGDTVVDENMAIQLLDMAEEMSKAGIIESMQDFKSIKLKNI